MSETDRRNLELDWEKIRDDEVFKYGGLGVGTVFQFAEHSPEKVEDVTGIDVPSSLFEDVFNPWEIDKGVHFAFSYSAATAMLETMEKTDRRISYPSKVLTVNMATLVGGSAKELTDNWYDPMDMAANFAGSNTALIHHKSRLEDKYENSLGIEIDDYSDFAVAEELHYHDQRDEFDVEEYLQEAD